MIVLVLRTDRPKAEAGIYRDTERLAYDSWQAHRQLAETIHHKIEKILNILSISWKDIEGIVIYKGPGSFTGLRIGMSVANALAYAYKIPVVARGGKNWMNIGIRDLLDGQDNKLVVPEYDAPASITKPKK